jgi:predicted small secreted protein
MTSNIILFAFAALLMVSLAACETMQGAGRDIEHAGESVQDAAE